MRGQKTQILPISGPDRNTFSAALPQRGRVARKKMENQRGRKEGRRGRKWKISEEENRKSKTILSIIDYCRTR